MTRTSRRLLAVLACSAVGISAVPSAAAPGGAFPRAAGESLGARVREGGAPAPRFVFGTGTPARGRTSAVAPSRPAREADVPATPTRAAGAPAPLSPIVGTSFAAIPRTGGNWPADPIGAKGIDTIVTAVNTHVAVYDAAGNALLGPISLVGLYPFPAGFEVFDPKVVYDQYAAHYVLVYLAVHDRKRRSRIAFITIPEASAADISTWCAGSAPGDGVRGNGRQWSDYPGLGYDANAVTITTNAFNFRRQRFAYAQILRFPKDTLYDETCTTPALYRRFYGRATRNPDGSKAFTIQPAGTVGTGGPAQFLVSYHGRRAVSNVVLWRIRDTANGQRLRRTALPVPRTTISPYGTQRGGTLGNVDSMWDPGDVRLINAFHDVDANRLYTAHVITKDLRPDDSTGGYIEAAIRWYEIAPAGRLRQAIVNRIGIIGTPETDAGWPAIGTDDAGNIFVTYSRASAVPGKREFLSAYVAEIPVGTKMPEILLLWPGEARMEAVPGPERWGDYNGFSRDPVDGSVVVLVNQFAADDGSPPLTRDWQQTVHIVSHG